MFVSELVLLWQFQLLEHKERRKDETQSEQGSDEPDQLSADNIIHGSPLAAATTDLQDAGASVFIVRLLCPFSSGHRSLRPGFVRTLTPSWDRGPFGLYSAQ